MVAASPLQRAASRRAGAPFCDPAILPQRRGRGNIPLRHNAPRLPDAPAPYPKCAKYCSAKSIPTKSLNAVISRPVTGPGTRPPSPTGDPFTADTGQMHKLVDVKNASSAV